MEIGVPVWLFALRYVLAAPENPLSTADTCFKIHALEFIFQFAHNILAAILRGIGSGKASLYFLRIACVFVAPGILFVCIFQMGMAGAAIAAFCSNRLLCGGIRPAAEPRTPQGPAGTPYRTEPRLRRQFVQARALKHALPRRDADGSQKPAGQCSEAPLPCRGAGYPRAAAFLFASRSVPPYGNPTPSPPPLHTIFHSQIALCSFAQNRLHGQTPRFLQRVILPTEYPPSFSSPSPFA